MAAKSASGVKPLIKGMQIVLLIAGLLVFIAGVQLFILGEQTDMYFAWTIKSPITAAFMGAGYWSSFALVVVGARQRYWAQARIAVPSPTVFSTLMLIATLLHLDLFHLGSQFGGFTLFATWAWIGVYAAIPLLLIALFVLQVRTPGVDPPRLAPLPRWARLVFGGQAAVMLALGAALFIAPQQTMGIWPWTLTPLTAQVVGGWLVGLGVAAAQAVGENDWIRLPSAAASYTTFGLFQLIAVARYPGAIDWSAASAWLYLAFMLGIMTLGLYSLVAVRRAQQRATLAQAAMQAP